MTGKQGLYDPAYEHDACGIGFVAHIHGVRSRDVVEKSLQLLVNLSHRSAVAADSCTGDGAGILLQLPHTFLRRVSGAVGVSLPDAGSYGVGMVFLPSRRADRLACERIVEAVIEVFQNRDALRGLRIVSEPPTLRHFTARFEELE